MNRRPTAGRIHRFDLRRRSVGELLDVAVVLVHNGDDPARHVVAAELADRLVPLAGEVDQRLRGLVAGLWDRGWQPVEAVRHVRRGCPAGSVRLLLAAVADDRRDRDAATLDARWVAQLESLDLPGGGVGAWFAAEPVALDAVVAAAHLLERLLTAPALEPLIPPPGAPPGWRPTVGGAGSDHGGAGGAATEADPVLERVRALLAKAESTTFEAEAEAFTAKAQQLIARHAIDAALLAEAAPGDDGPAAIRVFVDEPYVDAKTLLLQVVADAGRCRAVHQPAVAMSTVVGFASDLAAVELLFTSLLVQAQTALAAAARSAPPGARTRSRSYRSSFLLAYATRIGQRLEEVNAAVVAEAEAEQGRSLLPVLASRDAEVGDAVDELFGNLTTHTIRGGHDPAGWAGGRLAADAADLNRTHLDRGG